MKVLLRLAHFPFHELDDFFRLGHRVISGDRTDDGIGAFEENYRRRDAFVLGVWDDLRLPVGVDMGHGREGRAQVNSDCFSLRHGCEVISGVAKTAKSGRCSFHAGFAGEIWKAATATFRGSA